MSYKSEKIPINNPFLDKRVKLYPNQKKLIKKLAPTLSQRKLAKLFNVSRRTIQFIVDPNKVIENKKKESKEEDHKYTIPKKNKKSI